MSLYRRLSFAAQCLGVFIIGLMAASQVLGDANMQRPLTDMEKFVIENKGTERPFSGKFNDFFDKGLYVCRKCGKALFESSGKFKSGCGWPSFDEAVPGAVRRTPDADGVRTEITCAFCGAHLGHVFEGEKMTPKDTRYCVNSVSMDFIPEEFVGRAYVAGGCFWGVEALMADRSGVLGAVSGYSGGSVENPTYAQVCAGNTGHLECVEIFFDRRKISYSDILRRFFEIHDFSQVDGQGPDKGEQYLSAVFCSNAEEMKEALSIAESLKKRGYSVATKILPLKNFYPAEEYHQKYYLKSGKKPYCHFRRKIF